MADAASHLSPELSPLGKTVSYQDQYDPSLLFPIAREPKRQEIGIEGALPFMGVDLWNAFELSWLNARGKPVVALATFTIPADTPRLIESKSFKLYLNSFNQTRFDSVEAVRDVLARDLSEAAGGSVGVSVMLPERFAEQRVQPLFGRCIDMLDIETDCYTPNPDLLTVEGEETPVEETLVSDLLKSNCLVTGQPDWGSVQIHYVGRKINEEGLLKYLISFRQHNEFHEQCVERIFMDVMRRCKPSRLAVYARYTRRGGLDINPHRTNFAGPLPANVRTARQ